MKTKEKKAVKVAEMAAPVSASGMFKIVPRAACRPGLANPRKVFNALEELAESIRQQGIIEPLVVRPRAQAWTLHEPDLTRTTWTIIDAAGKEEHYPTENMARLAAGGEEGLTAYFELVAGHRRWRAAEMAGLTELPVMVREMSDADVVKVRLIENDQREDLNELEKAQGYKEAMESLNCSAEELAKSLGMSRSSVFGKLALLKLSPQVQEELLSGRIDASMAAVVSKVPGDPKEQKKFVERVTREDLSVRAAERLVKSEYMLDLAGAEFDQKDAQLVPEAGPCTKCPKRTGNARELFPEGNWKSPNDCTDVGCFRAKEKAHWRCVLEAATKPGQVALPVDDGRKLFGHGASYLNHGCDYSKVDEVFHLDKKHRTLRQLVGKKVTTYVALDGVGIPHELYRNAEAEVVLKEMGFKAPEPASRAAQEPENEQTSEERRKEIMKERLARALDAGTWQALLDSVEKDGNLAAKGQKDFWGKFTRLLVAFMNMTGEGSEEIERRRNERTPGGDWTKQDWQSLRSMAVEMLTANYGYNSDGPDTAMLEAAMELFDMDTKAVEKRIKAEFEEANRLPKKGEKIPFPNETKWAEVEASYSGEKLTKGQIGKPAEYRGYLWVQVGALFHGANNTAPDEHEVWRVLPKAEYKGKTHPYGFNKEPGDYEGELVMHGQSEFVMTGPKFFFLKEKAPVAKKGKKK